jgi:AcrR family transcriptional regulator
MTTNRRGRGRPRLNPRPVLDSPEEEILRAAGRIFAEKGFAATSTREIAAAAGLQGPSIFHYFPTKEDMLRALADRALVRPLATLEEVTSGSEPASVKLYRIVTVQVEHFCSQPFNLSPILDDLFRLPRDRFRSLFEAADRYTAGLRSLVEQGIEGGEFIDVNPTLGTMSILGIAVWTIRWYRKDGPLTAAEVAETFGGLALRSLLRDPERLPEIVRQAGLPSAAEV